MLCSTETTSLTSGIAISNQYKCEKHCVNSLDLDSSAMPLILADYLGKHLFTWQHDKALTFPYKVMGKGKKMRGNADIFSSGSYFSGKTFDIFYGRQKTGFPS